MTLSLKQKAAVLELVDRCQPITAAQVAKELGLNTESANKYLRDAESDGQVQRTVTGRTTVWELKTTSYGHLPGDLPRHLRARSIFDAGAMAAA